METILQSRAGQSSNLNGGGGREHPAAICGGRQDVAGAVASSDLLALHPGDYVQSEPNKY
jgi:hypothetical protein